MNVSVNNIDLEMIVSKKKLLLILVNVNYISYWNKC